MKKLLLLATVPGLIALGACNTSPREQAADNIESNADAVADNLEDMADNSGGMMANSLDNQADAVRNTGAAQAEDMRTHDADTNLANGM